MLLDDFLKLLLCSHFSGLLNQLSDLCLVRLGYIYSPDGNSYQL